MTPEQFTYWLQGFTEISGEQPTKEQWQVIKDHLQTVFHKVTPAYPPANDRDASPYKPHEQPNWLPLTPGDDLSSPRIIC